MTYIPSHLRSCSASHNRDTIVRALGAALLVYERIQGNYSRPGSSSSSSQHRRIKQNISVRKGLGQWIGAGSGPEDHDCMLHVNVSGDIGGS